MAQMKAASIKEPEVAPVKSSGPSLEQAMEWIGETLIFRTFHRVGRQSSECVIVAKVLDVGRNAIEPFLKLQLLTPKVLWGGGPSPLPIRPEDQCGERDVVFSDIRLVEDVPAPRKVAKAHLKAS